MKLRKESEKMASAKRSVLATVLVVLSIGGVQNILAANGPKKDAEMIEALSEHEQNHLDEAYGILQTVGPDSLSFRMAYLEMQKIHYKTQSWDQFFGFATYYRKKMLGNFFQGELLTLEALGLIKHCQFDAASQSILLAREFVIALKEGEKSPFPLIKELYQKELKRFGGNKDEVLKSIVHLETDMKAVEGLLLLQAKIPGKVNSSPVNKKARVFSKDMFWNIQNEAARTKVFDRAVLGARAVRVYVKNLCSKDGA